MPETYEPQTSISLGRVCFYLTVVYVFIFLMQDIFM